MTVQHLLLFTSASLLLLAAEPSGKPGGSAQTLYDQAAAHAKAGRPEAALDTLESSFQAGLLEPFRVLSDARFAPVLRDPETREQLRAVLRAYPATGRVAMTAPGEPGNRMEIVATIVHEGTNRPASGALVYVYQTDASGAYTPENPQGGNGSDNARLFAWVRTDAGGRFTASTVLPAGYAGTRNPRHIHLVIEAGGPELHTEFFLDMDPEIPSGLRRQAAQLGWPIVKPVRRGDGTFACTVTIQVR